MAGALRDHGGGIAGLLDIVEEHPDAIEYDLIALGLRLRWLDGETFDFADLAAIVRAAPPTSALYRAQYGEEAAWQLPEHLLAAMTDSLHWLVWAQSKDGQKNRNKPRPVPRPGLEEETERTTYSGKESAVPLEEMADWLGWAVN